MRRRTMQPTKAQAMEFRSRTQCWTDADAWKRGDVKLDRLLVTLSHSQAAGILSDLAATVESGFSSDDALRAAADLAALQGEDSLLVEPIVTVGGASVPFILDAYPADTAADREAVFITADPITTWLEKRLQALAPAVTVTVLRAS